jgi:hypothetical protein
MTLILPQLTNRFIPPNEAVALWDTITPNSGSTTELIASTPDPVSSPEITIPFAGTASFWLKRESTVANTIFNSWQQSSDQRGLNISLFGSNQLQLTIANNDNIYAAFTGALNSFTTWTHVLTSWNWFTSSFTWKVTINDTPAFSESRFNSGSRDTFYRGYFNVNGHRDAPATGYNSLSLYDVAFFDSVYDVYDINIRRKFIDASGNPVNLGSRGQRPFGSPPRLFFSGNFTSWRKNKGSLASLSVLVAGVPVNFTKSPTKPA